MGAKSFFTSANINKCFKIGNSVVYKNFSKITFVKSSNHLNILKHSGFVKTIKRGTWVFYKISISENFAEIDKLVNESLRIIEKVRKEQAE